MQKHAVPLRISVSLERERGCLISSRLWRAAAVVTVTFLSFAPLLAADASLKDSPPDAASTPDYMKHWEFGMDINEHQGPKYFSDLIFPLHRNANGQGVAFFEPRLTYRDRTWLANLGAGYRQLVLDKTWLLGGNTFYDYSSAHSHYRVGWGLEALSSYAELRANSYLGISPERLVEQTGEGNTFERAVNGFDLEAGAPVPYYSRLKVFGGFNWYKYRYFKNRAGWTLRTEYKPFPFIVIDGLVSDSTKSNVDWGMTVALRIPFSRGSQEPLRSPLKPDSTIFPESDAGKFFFSLVERHHEIVLERRRQTGTMSIEVRRGT